MECLEFRYEIGNPLSLDCGKGHDKFTVTENSGWKFASSQRA
jgi:hypothetical protein